MNNPETDSLACIVVDSSSKAYLLRDKDQQDRVSWFPKSQVNFHRRNMKTGEALAEIPLWLLTEKGWNN